MNILNRYVARSFLATFFMSIFVLTFGMTGGNLMKVFDYISRGIPQSTTVQFLWYTTPQALSYTIPWASLVAIMLVFGRLSADNEITAMRACGVSVLHIVSPVIMITFIFTCLCLYLQLQVVPRTSYKARYMLKEVALHHPLAVFTPGIPLELEGKNILFDRMDEKGNLYDISVASFEKDGTTKQDLSASHGRIDVNEKDKTLSLSLYDASVTTHEQNGDDAHFFSSKFTITFDYGKQFVDRAIFRKDQFLTASEMLAHISILEKQGVDTTPPKTELNLRVALALAPIAFLMLGLPVAIRTSRKETSIGLFMSVLLAGVYFGAVLLSDAMSETPKLYPQYLVWIVPFLYQICGILYLIKISRM